VILTDLGNHKDSQRCILCRFEHDGVAGANRRRNLECGELRWRIPRHDRAHHADRLTAGIAQHALTERHGQPFQFPRKSSEIAKRISHHARLTPRLRAQGITGLGCNRAGDFLRPDLKRFAYAHQLTPPITGGNLRPARESVGCRRDGPLHVFSASSRHLADWLAPRGVLDGDARSGHSRHPFATDQHAASLEGHGAPIRVDAQRIHWVTSSISPAHQPQATSLALPRSA